MERRIINRNTTVVWVTRNDLKERGIRVLDLLGNAYQIRRFFNHLFTGISKRPSVYGTPVTFKVLPNRDYLKIIVSHYHNQSGQRVKFRSKSLVRNRVVKLTNFEGFVKIAHLLTNFAGTSNLYLYNGSYYLGLTFQPQSDSLSDNKIKNELSMAYEYGISTEITLLQLERYAKVIMNRNALQLGRHYFR